MNRRGFLRASAGAAAFLTLKRRAYGYPVTPPQLGLTKWAQPMRGLLDIGVAAKDTSWTAPGGGASYGPDHYTIYMRQFEDMLHPNMPRATRLWGYTQNAMANEGRHLGPIIVAQRDRAVQASFINRLPSRHLLPVDSSPFFPDAATKRNKTAVHLHGGFVPWISDGGPFDWFDQSSRGLSFMNHYLYPANQDPRFLPPNAPAVAPVNGVGEYYYPNQQSARLMWYHDHAHDLTRLNAYAGIASGYLVTDSFEASLISSGLLPPLVSAYHQPLIIQDKIFDSDGQLAYPSVYEAARWEVKPGSLPLPEPSVVPEMFGDTMLANGTVNPYLKVEPRRYRFRILNACNARFVNLQLYVADNSADGITLTPSSAIDPATNGPVYVPVNPPGPRIVQIGTEGGFLPSPVVLNSPPKPIGYDANGNANRYTLLMAPAERADIVIDFSEFAGREIILYNDAPAPFPGQDPSNDYAPGVNPEAAPGLAPSTRQIVKFIVGSTRVVQEHFLVWLARMQAGLLKRAVELLPPLRAGALRRVLTLNEDFDDWGRLIQQIGTNVPFTSGLYGRPYESVATEAPRVGATEVWEIFNLTGDTHPIHFHLVNVQILDRQGFDPNSWPAPVFTGPAREPDANERGWKETVRMNPGEVTRVIMKFEFPKVPFVVPSSPRAASMGFTNTAQTYHEYVYHCHILEHEEHDMMRPLVVRG